MSARVVWKFPVRAWSAFQDVPRGAEILSVGVQGVPPVEEACFWALCDPDAPKVPRMVSAFPTGAPLPSVWGEAVFVGTIQIEGGLVFHIFDGGER